VKNEAWYFTFGAGQDNDGYYVIVRNCGFSEARQKMLKKYGICWSGQYTHDVFLMHGLNSKLELLEEM